jgi:hypothetical protein
LLSGTASPLVVFSAFWTAKMQHQPGGNAKVRLQASTRDRKRRFCITYHPIRSSSSGQGGPIRAE